MTVYWEWEGFPGLIIPKVLALMDRKKEGIGLHRRLLFINSTDAFSTGTPRHEDCLDHRRELRAQPAPAWQCGTLLKML